jgi:hypothetical protein
MLVEKWLQPLVLSRIAHGFAPPLENSPSLHALTEGLYGIGFMESMVLNALSVTAVTLVLDSRRPGSKMVIFVPQLLHAAVSVSWPSLSRPFIGPYTNLNDIHPRSDAALVPLDVHDTWGSSTPQ